MTTVQISSTSFAEFRVKCPAGKLAVAGGWHDITLSVRVGGSYPRGLYGGVRDEWAIWAAATSTTAPVELVAVCAKENT